MRNSCSFAGLIYISLFLVASDLSASEINSTTGSKVGVENVEDKSTKLCGSPHEDCKHVVFERTNSESDERQSASVRYELPWVNLHEAKGTFGSAALAYGADEILKNYLIDDHGCILQRNLEPNQLANTLAASHGNNSVKNAVD